MGFLPGGRRPRSTAWWTGHEQRAELPPDWHKSLSENTLCGRGVPLCRQRRREREESALRLSQPIVVPCRRGRKIELYRKFALHFVNHNIESPSPRSAELRERSKAIRPAALLVAAKRSDENFSPSRSRVHSGTRDRELVGPEEGSGKGNKCRGEDWLRPCRGLSSLFPFPFFISRWTSRDPMRKEWCTTVGLPHCFISKRPGRDSHLGELGDASFCSGRRTPAIVQVVLFQALGAAERRRNGLCLR